MATRLAVDTVAGRLNVIGGFAPIADIAYGVKSIPSLVDVHSLKIVVDAILSVLPSRGAKANNC